MLRIEQKVVLPGLFGFLAYLFFGCYLTNAFQIVKVLQVLQFLFHVKISKDDL
jgi:hypothetical protein